jgi:hypothetical protein
MKARRAVLATAVDRLVGAAECLGAVPVDQGDVRALAAIVGAQARVVEALAKLDAAQDRRRTGRVQRELLRARLATIPGATRDARGMVVVLPPEDIRTLSDVELRARLERLAASLHAEAAQEVAALGGDLPALAHTGLRELLTRAQEGDDAALIALSPVVAASRGTAVVVLPELEPAEPK